jgi:MraZ protein
MLIGEYKHNVDPKKRLSIPARMRRDTGDKVVITKGLDNCLFLFPMSEWDKLAKKLGELPMGQQDTRGFVRLMLSGAVEAELDQLGRVLLPDYLKEYAGIAKSATIVGVFNRLEIWDSNAWDDYKGNIEKNNDKIAEKLGELGVV